MRRVFEQVLVDVVELSWMATRTAILGFSKLGSLLLIVVTDPWFLVAAIVIAAMYV